jgi:hypothetical protein
MMCAYSVPHQSWGGSSGNQRGCEGHFSRFVAHPSKQIGGRVVSAMSACFSNLCCMHAAMQRETSWGRCGDGPFSRHLILCVWMSSEDADEAGRQAAHSALAAVNGLCICAQGRKGEKKRQKKEE